MRIFQAVEVTVEKDEIVWAVVNNRFVLSEECRGYALWLAHSGRAINTQKAYQLRLARFLSWCAETDTTWAALRFHQLAAYKASIDGLPDKSGGRLSGKTVNAHVTAVMVFLRYAVAHGFGTDQLRATVEGGRHAVASLGPEGPREAGSCQAGEGPGDQTAPRGSDPVTGQLCPGGDREAAGQAPGFADAALRPAAGEVLGLRLEDMHMLPYSGHLGCTVPGPHVHIVLA